MPHVCPTQTHETGKGEGLGGSLTPVPDNECEELRRALLVSQDTAIVQALLEFCLPLQSERGGKLQVSSVREIRQTIGSFIHYLFISEPSVANVVHLQTYPRCLLESTVQSIPSLHITIDTAFDNFCNSGSFDRMVFNLDLISHLAQYYNIRPILELASCTLDCAARIMLLATTDDEQRYFLLSSLPALVRLVEAFPVLARVVVRLLLALAKTLYRGEHLTWDMRWLPMTELDCWQLAQTLPEAEREDLVLRAVLSTLRLIFHHSMYLRSIFLEPPATS
ncbi:hypothetical protein Ciccas_004700 [Cichlidogyrus casuarinus]|uniref:Uncharacterized protein n=1 Tax=Cichlidogyrus casuarinus TaxID=1844966 RepID=A0ABD2QAT6_9PLAT